MITLIPRPLRGLRAATILLVFLLMLSAYLHRDGFFSHHNLTPFSEHAAKGSLRDFCRYHGWRPFVPPAGSSARRKVYDLSMFNDELNWLEIRLNETYHNVDYFVLVEGAQTFTGHPKPMHLRDNMERFAPYKDKIIYHELTYPPDFAAERTWDMEDHQRDAMLTQVFPTLTGAQKPNPGDVIIVADADEIVRPAAIDVLRSCAFPLRTTLRADFYYYGFQYKFVGPQWELLRATYYQLNGKTIPPVNLRNGDGALQPVVWWQKADLWGAAWHCSTCFRTMEQVLNKMSSFSHTSYNKEEYRQRDWIAERFRKGLDLFGREKLVYERVEGNVDMPRFVLENSKRFRYLLSRDGDTAGFEDYPP